MRFFLIFFSVVATLISLPAQAQVTAKMMEVRAKLEKDIQENLRNVIGTQLETQTFSVAVNIQMKETKPPEPAPLKKPEVSDKPLGLDLGVIDVQGLMDSYERELAEARAKQEPKNKNTEPQFQISSINVTVGLDERYPEAYRAEFGQWLSKRMTSDYGSLAKSAVNVIRLTEKTKAEIEQEKTKTWLDHLKSLQALAGMFLLATALFVGLTWVGFGLRRVATAQKSLAIQQLGDWNLNGEALGAGSGGAELDGESATLQKVETLPSNHDLETQIAKIAFVCMELKDRVNELVRVWIDNGEDGIVKTALLVDAIITAREKILARAGAIPQLQIPLDPELVQAREESLAEAFREVAQMEIEDRLPRLERIYWDLISVRTLGLQSMRRPFDFLGGMNTTEIQTVLQGQKSDARALAVMYMEPAVQAEFVNTLAEPDREQMIAGVLAYNQVPQKTIWDMDTSVKVASMTVAEPNKERVVNLFPRTLEVLGTLNSLDEIRILRRIVPSLPDQGHTLKTQYSTLAFVDLWRSEYVRKLAGVATGDELTTLIRTVPTAKDRILSECPPKVKTIVEDDLQMNSVLEDSISNNRLDALRAKWNRILASEKISLARVVESTPPAVQEGGAHAA